MTVLVLELTPAPALAADPSFVLMWVGSGAGEGLERGREVLAKWGFRRCEDIVWVKTNKSTNRGPGVRLIAHPSVFHRLCSMFFDLRLAFFPRRQMLQHRHC